MPATETELARTEYFAHRASCEVCTKTENCDVATQLWRAMHAIEDTSAPEADESPEATCGAVMPRINPPGLCVCDMPAHHDGEWHGAPITGIGDGNGRAIWWDDRPVSAPASSSPGAPESEARSRWFATADRADIAVNFRAMEAELSRLRSENEQLYAIGTVNPELQRENARLRSELESARKDGERLEWLGRAGLLRDFDGTWRFGLCHAFGTLTENISVTGPTEIRGAVDAALARIATDAARSASPSSRPSEP